MAKKKEVIKKATAAVQKSFNLSNFKKKKGYSNASIKFKEQGWIPLSKAFQFVEIYIDAISRKSVRSVATINID